MTDTQLRRAFQECSLAEDIFTHEAHIRMGWIYVRSMPLTDAISAFCSDLKAYTRHLGATDKYHETITWFFLLLINERNARLDIGHTWEDFRAANLDLLEGGGTILKRYYSGSSLASDSARTNVVLPDLILP